MNFERQHVKLVRYVHPTESRFLDSEAEIDMRRRSSAHPGAFEIRTMQTLQLRCAAEQQMRRDASWVGRVKHFFNKLTR